MIYDITQPLFECEVYPGDRAPEKITVCGMEKGYRLTNIELCVHNGTHVDAPSHFIGDGRSIDELSLDRFIGPAYVAAHSGDVSGQDAERILARARLAGAGQKILIKGKATVTADAAKVFASAGIHLIGNESQSVGPEDRPMEVHLILLGSGVVLLEGIRLAQVPEGAYFLNCAPLNLTGTEGAPCRAVLITDLLP